MKIAATGRTSTYCKNSHSSQCLVNMPVRVSSKIMCRKKPEVNYLVFGLSAPQDLILTVHGFSPDVCPNSCKGGDGWHGTDLTDDILTLISKNVLVSLLLHKRSFSYPTFTIISPRYLINASCPYPRIWALLRPDGLLVLLPKEVLEGWDCPGGKWQLVIQIDLYTLIHTYTCWVLFYTPRLDPISNSSVPSLMLEFYLTGYFTLTYTSQILSFFLPLEREGGFFPFTLSF